MVRRWRVTPRSLFVQATAIAAVISAAAWIRADKICDVTTSSCRCETPGTPWSQKLTCKLQGVETGWMQGGINENGAKVICANSTASAAFVRGQGVGPGTSTCVRCEAADGLNDGATACTGTCGTADKLVLQVSTSFGAGGAPSVCPP